MCMVTSDFRRSQVKGGIPVRGESHVEEARDRLDWLSCTRLPWGMV